MINKLSDKIETDYPVVGLVNHRLEFRKFSIFSSNIAKWKARFIWNAYWAEAKAVVFIINSQDEQAVEDVKYEIDYLLEFEPLKDAVILIFANKQDLKDVLTVQEISEILDINSIKNRTLKIQPWSTITLDGIYEGFDWLSKSLHCEPLDYT